jgi:hypothetical protein
MAVAEVDTSAADAAQAVADKAVLDKAASDTAASEKAAADQAAADKVAADKAAADAATAGLTPEQIAAKTAADAETARKAAESAKAPEKYELQLPANSLLDATDVAQMRLEAKALGLSEVQTQALLNARSAAIVEQADAYLAEVKADKALGGERYDTTKRNVEIGVQRFFEILPADELALVKAVFNKSGYGNNKAFVRAFAHFGAQQREDTPVAAGRGGNTPERKPTAEVLFKSSAQTKA